MSALAAPVTDLSLTKTNGVSTIVPGTATTYTITVTNAGPSNATGATVTDLFPAALTNVTWTCATPAFGSCSAAAGSGHITTTVTLPVGATAIFTATATVAPDAVGVLVNTATVAPGPGASDPSSANNTDADTLTPRADVVLTKTGPATALPGDTLVYTVTVRNDGPSNAERVVVRDPTPAGLTFVATTGDCTTPFPCDLGTVLAGTTRTITATFTVPAGAVGPSPLVNIAEVSSTTPDPDPANNTARLETTLNFDADVEVSKSVPPGDVQVGDTVVVTVSALNHGPNRATGVEVTDKLPGGFAFTAATATHGTYDDATGTWTIGDLAPGTPARLDLTATLTGPGSITNLAVKTGQNEPDPNSANDSAAATTNAVPAADLVVHKTVNNREPLVGHSVTFTVNVTNRGPSPATGVAVHDALPAGVTLGAATPSQGSYDAASGLWTIGALGVLDEVALTVTATVAASGVSSNNAALAARDQVDPNPLNDTAAVSINAAPNADLRVAKAASNLAPAVGAEVTYTIAVTNLGPSAATSAEILDLLPAGLTFVSATASQGTYAAATGVWTLGAIPATGTETLSLTARVTQLGSLANSAARLSSAPIDPNSANDGAAVVATPVTMADVAIVKTPATATVIAGGTLTWTIVMTNRGPSPIAGAQVSDAFLPALGNIQWTCSASVGAACAASSGTGSINTTVDLPQGRSATFVATGVTDPAVTGVLDSAATVAVPAGASDPDLSNNTGNAPVQVGAISELEVTWTGTPQGPVSPGTTIVYTATVFNRGPSAAAAVTLVSPTPAGLTIAGVNGACSALPCALSGIAPSQSRAVAIGYTVPPDYSGPDQIVATVTATSTSDVNPSNNTATVTTTVSALADLTIVNAGPATAAPGRTAIYSVTIENAGRGTADGVVVDDQPPAGLSFVSASAPCASGFPCAMGSLAPGASVSVTVTFGLPRTPSTGTIASTATVRSATGETTLSNNEATSVARIVRAGCDVNGDGLDEIVTAAGPGGGPHVQVFDVANGGPSRLASFYAYHSVFGGGAFVACGDVDGDGRADVVTGAGPGGGPHVRVFSFPGRGAVVEIASFYAYESVFGGGVRVATADVDGDGVANIITVAGPFGGPHLRVFTLVGSSPIEIAGFYAYDPSFAGGVFVAGGDVTGDGRAEIITGTSRAGGPVRVFSLDAGGISERLRFFPYIPGFSGYVRVAAGDVNGDGIAEIITGAGPGGGPHVVVWSLAPAGLTPLASFYAYHPLFCDIGAIAPDPVVCDGVHVGAGDVDGDGAAEVITGTNRQGGPLRVFQIGAGVIERLSFHPYFEGFRGPVHVAAGMSPLDSAGVATDGRRRWLLLGQRSLQRFDAIDAIDAIYRVSSSIALHPSDRPAAATAGSRTPSMVQPRTVSSRGRSPPGRADPVVA
jgi:uncharacterized repeat protein (TIGR01451 family)